MSAMRIGPDQLGNVIRNQTKFAYFDLRLAGERSAVLPREAAELLLRAEPVAAEDVPARVSALGASVPDGAKDWPIVFICEDGERSGAVADALDAAGFINVFAVRGGVAGL